MTAAAATVPPSPLPDDRRVLLTRLVDGLDGNSLWWLSGFAAGLAQGHPPPSLAVIAGGQPAAQASGRLTIVYGSQTGNARRAAEQLAGEAEAAGLAVRLVRADAYPTRELAGERLLYIVISTQGEGDPPDDAIGLVEFIAGKRAPKLPELRYAVLGLGDSSYADFCGIGRRLDARLAELGAHRLQPAGEADLDIESVAAPWRTRALADARRTLGESAAPAVNNVTPLRQGQSAAHSAQHPFHAELLARQRVSGRDFKGPAYGHYGRSDKHVHHVELSLEGSGLHYEPGDALGIVHRNPPQLVDAVLAATGLDGDTGVSHDGHTRPLAQWLGEQRELTRLSRPLLATVAERSGNADLAGLLEPARAGELAAVFADHQLVDVLHRWPADWDASALVATLRPAAHRLYSIASSRKRVGDEVHLTVDELAYDAHGRDHVGAASAFLAALEEGAQVPVFVEPNERFRVPVDASRDIIMIGPGTGVAPFRGFVQERAETGAAGRNWLFFGARHFNRDFLYQVEWQDALQRKELHRLDLAFSRDQAEKIYVQQRLREQGRDLYDWLQGGAHLYVCGAIGMGKDVHAALLDIVAAHNGGDAEAAAGYLSGLQRDGRYARDVY
ncbi:MULTISPECIES: assimilatory sulfite reductase (NADPH) flavoprotein subunit [Stenotrophomonas]|uniref:NADP oxidoreductase n=1 Tax=Stenotrophomonas nitritireducens TaxID=83617 RepID=A0ABR5NGJ9_9GAMM|nr:MULTISPECIES: assimilatory sulfite reductase (NADPH) flavoprotein subunit [Stenotrophomonas]KQN96512.1 NADP oxidoreductase [Stenotrophomonas sp. Leaf70]KRG54813.1 NADP oxidoreductase [Stenotrophomonas nitritireducens]